MDIQLTPHSRQSTFSGEPFVSGDRLVSYLCKTKKGELYRADIHERETGEYKPEGDILCWWRHIKQDKQEASSQRQAIDSAEDFFFSLYGEIPEMELEGLDAMPSGGDSDNGQAPGREDNALASAHNNNDDTPAISDEKRDTSGGPEEVTALKYLFSAILERKRILRSVPGTGKGNHRRLIHVKSKREYEVPIKAPSPETILRIQQHLDFMV